MADHYIPSLQKHLYNECNYNLIKQSFLSLADRKNIKKKSVAYKGKCEPTENNEPTENENNSNKKEYYTLFTVARMILLNPQIESVITYNFDNFLRQAVNILAKSPESYFSDDEIMYLKERYRLIGNEHVELSDRIKVQDIHDNDFNSPGNISIDTFPIYHIHGYIPDPNEEEIADTPDIVMALEEFVEQQTAGLSWQDAVQVKAFRDSNILFIGCSMTDLTMKRMINYAHSCGYNNKIFILDAVPES